jgi:hypothetical protein
MWHQRSRITYLNHRFNSYHSYDTDKTVLLRVSVSNFNATSLQSTNSFKKYVSLKRIKRPIIEQAQTYMHSSEGNIPKPVALADS